MWWPVPKVGFNWKKSVEEGASVRNESGNIESDSRLVTLKNKHVAVGVLILISALLAFSFLLNSRQYEFPRVTMLDVGQGDAFLIQSEGKNFLVDTGTVSTKLYEGLGLFGIYHLDGIIISHADDDHCGSLADLRGIVSVDAIYVTKGMKQLQAEKAKDLLRDSSLLVSDENIFELEPGDVLRLGSSRIEVLGPTSCTNEGGNEDSLCFLFKAPSNALDGYWDVFFCGDAEAEQLESLVNANKIGDIDICKVGHHGSKGALSNEVLTTLKPELALVSAGENNRYGHPNAETLTLLNMFSVEVMRSDQQGSVVCNLAPERITVQTMR